MSQPVLGPGDEFAAQLDRETRRRRNDATLMTFQFITRFRTNSCIVDIQRVLISCRIAKTDGRSFRAMLQAAHGNRLVFERAG
jgi:hypothetical protein